MANPEEQAAQIAAAAGQVEATQVQPGGVQPTDAATEIMQLRQQVAGMMQERQTLAAQADREVGLRVAAAQAAAREEAAAAVERDRALSFRHQGRTPKPALPKTYKGATDRTNVNSWIFSMRQYLEASHCESEEEAVRTLATYLDETALLWYERGVENRLPGFPGGAVPVTFAGFADMMKDQFQSRALIERARDRLQQLAQTGALSDYVNSFRELRLRIPDSNATEAEFVSRFVTGLKEPAVKYKVYEQTPVSLEDAIVWAERVTVMRTSYRERYPSKWGFQSRTQLPEPMVSQISASTPVEGRRCWKCHEIGHLSFNCPLKGKTPGQGRDQGRGRGRGRGWGSGSPGAALNAVEAVEEMDPLDAEVPDEFADCEPAN